MCAAQCGYIEISLIMINNFKKFGELKYNSIKKFKLQIKDETF